MQPSYYEFYNPVKVLAGEHALEHISHELEQMGAHRPLILSDAQLQKIGILDNVLRAFDGSVFSDILVYVDIPADPSILKVNEIAAFYRTHGCDSLVAAGGGSVIDTAKGVKICVSQDSDDIMKYMGNEILPRGKRVPFIVIPTTAGTGSEATLVAVISNPAKNVKMEFISYELLPDAAILDPRMTATLPPRITAAIGIDTLCHAIEAYTCLQKNPVSDAYAIASLKLVSESLRTAVTRGSDKNARSSMAQAAFLAGGAFSNSMVGLVHAIGHAAGAVSHLPHGEVMGILLPHVMRFNMETVGELYGELLLYLAGPETYAATPKAERAEKVRTWITDILRDFHEFCGLPTTLSGTGASREQFEIIAKKAVNDGAILVNPRSAGIQDILSILEAAY